MTVVSKLKSNASDEDANECIDWKLPLSFVKLCHTDKIEGVEEIPSTWRMREKMKTMGVALMLCLNIGVDPPDVIKTEPCARLECWIDPLSLSATKALETIGGNLQKQYEKWQPRARYKQSLDPTIEDVKKLCIVMRRNAKDERVLFHYNGHGVPKPSPNGEIWVFNKAYTQYIPLSIYDVLVWMGTPSIYVYDCSNAGVVVSFFKQFAEQQESEQANSQCRGSPTPKYTYKSCIQLAACAVNQVLPMNPDLPADLFTSCLTTPMKVAFRWYVLQTSSKLNPKATLEMIDKVPGQINDRRTMLGELNWIFTAITDTIAWNTLSTDVFHRLFRQDLLVASLFRNFLLADRVMRAYDCTPVSYPQLPPTFQHPMWQAWDLTLDMCLSQLPGILESDAAYVHSPFFEEQLTAFQVWLELGREERSPPEQLPIVLQVLLSQVHRTRALDLLGRFLDLGPWAVNLALSVGIYPYVLKLLQSCAKELRPLLVFIWAKLLSVDSSCQADLVRDNAHRYFLSCLQDTTMESEHRTLAAYVLACIVSDYETGQEACLQGSLVSICLEQLCDPNTLLRQWAAICLGRLWDNYDSARWCGVRDIAHEKLYPLLTDLHPEVRAAAVYALGTFISSTTDRSEHANTIDHSVATMLLNTVSQDMSPLVRQELVVALQWMVLLFESSFVSVALTEEGKKESPLSPSMVVVNDLMTLSPNSSLKRTPRDRKISASGILGGEGLMSAVELLPFTPYDRIKRVSSSSSLSSLGNDSSASSRGYFSSSTIGKSFMTPIMGSESIKVVAGNSQLPSIPFGSIYMKLWHGMENLEKDPYPGVSKMCHTILEKIRQQAREIYLGKEIEARSTSISLPPSPSSRHSFLSSESPPTSITSASSAELNRMTPRIHGPKIRFQLPNTISEEAEEAARLRMPGKEPLVSTQFFQWRSKHFAMPVITTTEDSDSESKSYYEREWRYLRNAAVRRECTEEQKRIKRLEHQVFNSKTPDSPKVVMFHPYETHVAVAAKDCYGIWDWNNGSKLCYMSNGAGKGTCITSMQWVNVHDVSLLMTGSDDGTVRVWGNYLGRDGKEPKIVTAWQALPDVTPSSRAVNVSGAVGMVMSWEQKSHQLIAAGDTPKMRIWDAEVELKVADIPIGSDSSVTSVSTDPTNIYLLAAGCVDGSVRLFDRRLSPQDARVMSWREHSGWVVNVHLRAKPQGDGMLMSGCVAGDVRKFDIRKHSSVLSCHTSQGMTAMAVHDSLDVFTCGSVNQFISVFKKDGNPLNVIKYHEGFMGTRNSPVSCLALHPYRAALAAGSIDCNLSVYSGDGRR